MRESNDAFRAVLSRSYVVGCGERAFGLQMGSHEMERGEITRAVVAGIVTAGVITGLAWAIVFL